MLGVANLERAIRLFQRAYGWDTPTVEQHIEFGAQIAHFSNTPVMLASPLNHNSNSPLSQRLAEFGEIPAAFLLKTPDLRKAANRFPLLGESNWFGRKVAWFDPAKLHGFRLGLLQS